MDFPAATYAATHYCIVLPLCAKCTNQRNGQTGRPSTPIVGAHLRPNPHPWQGVRIDRRIINPHQLTRCCRGVPNSE